MSSPTPSFQSLPGSPIPTHPGSATEIGDVGAFIERLAGGVSTLGIEAERGGPPPEVLAEIAAAASFVEQMHENGYQLRFFSRAQGERPRIELHDREGHAVSVLSTLEAFELAADGAALAKHA
ncbi:MAG TPA: hypothetical protein VGY13_05065 [Solirubrobacteraceae bacterium]|jgi:hypothetical protein|nr:hypothetical protein [Solirubrobacteraceae bacterium]